MEQNNFEKKVHQKMDELRIQPTDQVWANVEKRIAKKNRKKIIFILFFTFLFLLIGAFWFFIPTERNPAENGHALNNNIEKNKPIAPVNPQTKILDITSAPRVNALANSEPEPANTLLLSTTAKPQHITIHSVLHKNRDGKKNKITSKKFDPANSSMDTVLWHNEVLKNVTRISDKDAPSDSENTKQNNALENSSTTLEKAPWQDPAFLYKSNADTLLKKTEETFTAKPPAKHLKRHKWMWGATLAVGQSFLSNKFLSLDKEITNYYNPPNSAGAGGSNSGSGAQAVYPVKIINSTGLIAGAFLEKKISKKGKISLGINYRYLSTINNTGSKIDSTMIAFRSGVITNRYRNNFHYLELPVSLKFQLNKNSTLPLWGLAGINVSQLISSNALQFKPNPGIYYRDNTLLQNTQWGFSAGLFATLFSQKKNPVNIGPYFYINASSAAKEGLYHQKHFNFLGISAEVLLNKK
ncbi:MAG: hypothetical protein JSS98_13530 [Bacteroidetes bacterium]|nr:hypothetical protein [Bacteroidota bacterium]